MKPGFDYIGVNVGFICHDGQGKILLHLRSDQCRDEHNTWDAGGGQIEFGETLEQALLREVKEEYDCNVFSFDHIVQLDLLRKHEGQQTHWLANIFTVHVDPATVKVMEPRKNLGIAWHTLNDLPSPLHSVPTQIFATYFDRIQKSINTNHAR